MVEEPLGHNFNDIGPLLCSIPVVVVDHLVISDEIGSYRRDVMSDLRIRTREPFCPTVLECLTKVVLNDSDFSFTQADRFG